MPIKSTLSIDGWIAFTFIFRFSAVLAAIIWDLPLRSDAKSTTSTFPTIVQRSATIKVRSTVDVTQKMENISLQLVRVIIIIEMTNRWATLFWLNVNDDGVVVSFMVTKDLSMIARDILVKTHSISDHVLRVLDSSNPGYRRVNRIQAKDVGYVSLKCRI